MVTFFILCRHGHPGHCEPFGILKKPMTDEECFKMIFFLGNGLEPRLPAEWVILTQHWCHDQKKMEKRARQIGSLRTWISKEASGFIWHFSLKGVALERRYKRALHGPAKNNALTMDRPVENGRTCRTF